MAAFPLIALHLRCCLGTAKVVKHRDVILRIRALAGEIIADHDAIHAAGECHGLQASKIQLTPAGGADLRLRQDEAEHRKRTKDLQGRKTFIVFIRSAGDRVQHIERHRIDMHILQVKCHFHALIQRLAESEDPAAADADTRLLGARHILRFFFCGVRGADLLEEGRRGFDIAMQTTDTGLLQLVRLFLREEAEGAAYLDADLLADPTDQIQDLRKVLRVSLVTACRDQRNGQPRLFSLSSPLR